MGRLALVLILSVATLVVSAERSTATPSGSYVVVEITGFFGPDFQLPASTSAIKETPSSRLDGR